MKSKIFYIICFVVLILLSLFNIFYFMKYDILTEHDLCYVFHRSFLDPEHGRYLATFMGNIFTQKIPEFLNIHINDFQPIGATSIKAFFIIIMCILIANAGFLFKNKNFFNILNPAFLFIYSLVFLLLFNCFSTFGAFPFKSLFSSRKSSLQIDALYIALARSTRLCASSTRKI